MDEVLTLLNNNFLLQDVKEDEPAGVFEILGVQYNELACSNFYSYFFNTEENHGLKNIFFEELVKLIQKQIIDFSWEGDTPRLVLREFVLEDLKRIDILLLNSDSIEKATRAIIIENKLYAELYNQLRLYDQQIKAIHKIVVILSINKCHTDFGVEIKHTELIEAIAHRINKDNLNFARPEASVLFNGFRKSVRSMTAPPDVNEAKFILTHRAAVNKLESLKEKAVQQVDMALRYYLNTSGYSKIRPFSNGLSFQFGNSPIRLYINTQIILSDGKFSIYAWINTKDAIQKWNSWTGASWVHFKKDYCTLEWSEKTSRGSWVNIAWKEGYNLDLDSQFFGIDKVLEDNWNPAMRRLIEKLEI